MATETLGSIAGSFSGHRKLSGFSRAEGLSNPGGKVDTVDLTCQASPADSRQW